MKISAEIRWFFNGMINNDILVFFKENNVIFREEQPRTDWYLLNNDKSTSVKLRDDQLEIKKLINSFELKMNQDIRGNAERWVKFGFNIHPGEDDREITSGTGQQWLRIDKSRSVSWYEVLNDGTVRENPQNEPAEGCMLEICFIKTMKMDFWTFAVEATGINDTVEKSLEIVMKQIFRNAVGLSVFETGNSYSYPLFIGKLSML